ncbi:YhcN/YlaJ family sporulation lipoprotein [Psychrobacillus sp. OK032]|uniref:YhcN/YlaJ family sporulation lipoprotein n=1 Tax=Psychrobacillus sp. OK032 TaxID=1884358 RepID=UPI0008C1F9E3|nr:YhcN/YlaJ family sporulation lipoprotein [Psychrobacillus sp. OK032]SER97997.1 sporulation lipoprotein, YhcN/YlaJ family [Psychrobacillus sp. OK032]
MNKLLQISMTMLLVGSLAACGTNNKDDVADNNATTTDKVTDTNINTDTNTVKTGTDHANNEGHKVELADDIADKIKGMEEVKGANVFVTDNNAYVAVDLKEGVDASEELENKIADEARATNANFNNVYVTTNPDFTKQFNEYGEKIRANEPVEGFFKEFSDTVKRVFPDAH